MWSPIKMSCWGLALLVALTFSGCGYQLASTMPSVIGDGTRTLKVKGVDSPTLHPWLPYAIRSELRNEIGARYLARWVDSGFADYEIQVNVHNFSTREWIRTEQDATQLYATSLSLEAVIYDGRTNREVWRSGHLFYSEYEAHANEQAASGHIISQIIRQLADKMRQEF